MTLMTNLPFAFLTVEQNDYYAGLDVAKPVLTTPQSMSVSTRIRSREGFEFFEDLIARLDDLWERAQHWDKTKGRLLVMRTYDSANSLVSIHVALKGIEFTTIVKELQRPCDLVVPQEWLDDLRELFDRLDRLSRFAHIWIGLQECVHGDFRLGTHTADGIRYPAYFQYHRMIFAIPGNVHVFTPALFRE